MLSEFSLNTLSELLMKIIEGENKVEIMRKCLCENIDFQPLVLFKSLCNVYNEFLLPKDIKEFLEQNGESATDQDAYLLVRQYSSSQNGKLSFEDFTHFVVTSTKESLSELVFQRSFGKEIKTGVKYSFLSLLKEEIKLQKESESLKTKLFEDSEFSLWKAFEMLNTANKGYISEEDFVGFFKKFNVFINSDDYDSLMRRIDLEDDLAISYNEFLEALIPLQIPRKDAEKNGEKSVVDSEGFKTPEKRKDEEQDRPICSDDLENNSDVLEKKSLEDVEFTEKTGSVRKYSNKGLEYLQFIGEGFVKVLENERKLEFSRQDLSMVESFSISQAFSLADKENSGAIDLKTFEEFLSSLNINTQTEVLENVIRFFSNSQDLTLNIENFGSIFMPSDREYSDMVKKESETQITSEALEKIKDVLENIIQNQEKIQDFKKNFSGIGEEELKECFSAVDNDDDGEISIDDLKVYYKKLGRNTSDGDRAGVISWFSESKQTIYFSEFKKLIY